MEVAMEEYLRVYHKNDIIDLMNDAEDSSRTSIYVDLAHLSQTSPNLFHDVLTAVHVEALKWSECLLEQQKIYAEVDAFLDPSYQIKTNSWVRFVNLPELDARIRSTYPTNHDIGDFVQIKGTVLRCTQPKFLEYKRDFTCGRCKISIPVEGEYAKYYAFNPPTSCSNGCVARMYSESKCTNTNCIDYQEITIMEPFTKKSMPSVITVTLEHDLVESCQPGDSITVCGTVESRWSSTIPGKPTKIFIVIRANSISNNMQQVNIGNDLPEHLICVRAEWQEFKDKFGELAARDTIIQSICPDVHGMYLAKLAVALAICSATDESVTVSGLRNHSHILLIGDPGLAKSRLLKFASSITIRSIHTTGAGCSSAGLTASAVKEDGEWHLEAGALVLADNGICCIDEFNLMSENEKSSLHEAMEQQTISMAKADIACKLKTRCVIIAATNPKNLYSMTDEESTTTINLGIASPLLSRFDLVLILRDERNVEWDTTVADHILFGTEFSTNENMFDFNKLQTHFAAVRNVDPVVTDGAHRILKAYYTACRSDEYRDAGRTTLRLNDSLYRLAKAHAKLLFRYEVTEMDAVLVVMLMESSFGFGRILVPMNIVRKDIPLGPSDVQIQELMDKFHLGARTVPDNNRKRKKSPPLPIENNSLQENIISDGNDISIPSVSEKTPEVVNDRIHLLLSKYQFKKRHIDHSRAGTSNDENISPNECVIEPSLAQNVVTTTDEIAHPLSENHQRCAISTRSLNQSQKIPLVASTSSRWTRISNAFDEDELDKLFSLDSPVKASEPSSFQVQAEAHQPNLPITSTSMNFSTQQEQNKEQSTVSNQEQSQEQSQSQRRRFFSRFREADLSCLDDLDF